MQHYQKTSEHIVVIELRKRLETCGEELLDLLSNWHYLQNVLQPQLLFTYDTLFGDLEVELQNKIRIASELERRMELLSIKLQKGEQINKRTIDFVNKVVKNEFNRMESQYKENNYKQDDSFHDKSNNNAQFNNEIPSLYRKIVKKLHPDVAGESEYFRKFWDNVQDAYKNRNYHRLKLFHKILYPPANENISNPRIEEITLRTEIRELEMSISTEKKRIEGMMKQEPFIFVDKLEDEAWINRRKRRLLDKLFQIDLQIHRHERLLNSLIKRDKSQPELFEYSERNPNKYEYWSKNCSF